MKFDEVISGQGKLVFDESPFVHLTANPQYLDVLCVNCYECVSLLEVDSHSLVCRGPPLPQGNENRPRSSQSGNNKEDSLIVMEREISLINDKLDKLTLALRNRLFEIEIED
jgi:hypothetical protein